MNTKHGPVMLLCILKYVGAKWLPVDKYVCICRCACGCACVAYS
jgi:hypothetical protein